MFRKLFKKIKSICILCISILFGCSLQPEELEDIPSPKRIRKQAVKYSKEYIGVPYVWGGQSSSGMDCSGLVIRSYRRAVKNTYFELPFDDTTVNYLYKNYTKEIKNPRKGDLIFMGDDDVSHVSIFLYKEDGYIYFIDAYSKSNEVSIRKYKENHYKIKSFGRLYLRRKYGR